MKSQDENDKSPIVCFFLNWGSLLQTQIDFICVVDSVV